MFFSSPCFWWSSQALVCWMVSDSPTISTSMLCVYESVGCLVYILNCCGQPQGCLICCWRFLLFHWWPGFCLWMRRFMSSGGWVILNTWLEASMKKGEENFPFIVVLLEVSSIKLLPWLCARISFSNWLFCADFNGEEVQELAASAACQPLLERFAYPPLDTHSSWFASFHALRNLAPSNVFHLCVILFIWDCFCPCFSVGSSEAPCHSGILTTGKKGAHHQSFDMPGFVVSRHSPNLPGPCILGSPFF